MSEAVLAGLIGLLIGSFLNVCIYRLPRDLSVVRPRSYCPACKRQIAWYDNVPLFAWLWLKGRCRWCAQPIALRYPLVELATGVLFFWIVYALGWTLAAFRMCVFAAIMVDLIVTDLADRILPDEFTLGGAAAALILAPFVPLPSQVTALFFSSDTPHWILALCEAAIGGAVPAGLLWLMGAVYRRVRKREGLGLGDVKMILMVGAFLGLPAALLTVFLGSILGALMGAAYIWFSGADYTYELPFGTFLGVAAIVVGLFGDPIMAWYWRLGT